MVVDKLKDGSLHIAVQLAARFLPQALAELIEMRRVEPLMTCLSHACTTACFTVRP